MTGDCLCLVLGIECCCVRPGPGGVGYRPHGTLAAVRRHYRHGERPCRACRQAQAADNARRGQNRPSRSRAAVAARELAAEQTEQAARRAVLAAALAGTRPYRRREAA